MGARSRLTRGPAEPIPARARDVSGRPPAPDEEAARSTPTAPGKDHQEAVTVLEITDEIDLHGFQPRDVLDVVESYLEAAQEGGLTEVRLIHGRGTGLQRARVRALLEHSPRVRSFADAPAQRGGWGATIARLEKA